MSNKFLFANNAFYPYAQKELYVSAGTWPQSGVDVDESVFIEYTMMGVPDGKVRSTDEDGMPCWVDIPPLTSAEVKAQNETKRDYLLERARQALIVISTDILMSEQTGDDDTKEKKIRTKLKEMIDFLKNLDLEDENITWPEVPEL